MGKKSAVMATIAAAAIFTACGNSDNTNAESVSEITSAQETEEITEATSAQEQETAQSAETVSISAEEKEEIQSLLTEAGKFSYGYLQCKEIIHNIDENEYITIPKTNKFGNEYEFKGCLVTGGEITSMDEFSEKALSIFTERAYKSFDYILTYNYAEEDGKLYLWNDAGSDGSLLGTDYAYIVSAEEPDEETIVLNMTAFGAGENWDLPYDMEDNFSIELKRTEDGLRVDTFDSHVEQYITWAYTPERDLI